MRSLLPSLTPRVSVLLLCACGDGPVASTGTDATSSTGEPITTSSSTSTGSSSSGVEPTTIGSLDDTTATSSPMDPPDLGPGLIPDLGTIEPPATCDGCAPTAPASLNDGANEERNPGRDVAELPDGRGLAASHYLADGRVTAAFFDPMAATWETPDILRDAGEWNSIEYTTVAVVPTADGAVVVEDANGDVFAHDYDLGWGQAEFDAVPGYRYLLDVEPTPDGRVAALVSTTLDPFVGVGALYVALFDPAAGEWSPDPVALLDDPLRDIDRATIAMASDDGDAVVAFASLPEVGNYPRTVELHHYDSETEAWTLAHTLTDVEFFIPGVRELEPGQFAYAANIYGEVLRPFDEDLGVGDPIAARFPDDYAEGTMRSVEFGLEGYDGAATESLTYRSYSWDDPEGTTDVLDIPTPIETREVFAQDGRGYAYWTTNGATYDSYVAVHGPDGWADPVLLGSATHAIFRSSIARNHDGDVVFAWTPGCFGGPCDGDPTSVAVYREEATCWQPTLTFDGAFDARAYPFSTTRDFALVTAVEGYVGRMLGCG